MKQNLVATLGKPRSMIWLVLAIASLSLVCLVLIGNVAQAEETDKAWMYELVPMRETDGKQETFTDEDLEQFARGDESRFVLIGIEQNRPFEIIIDKQGHIKSFSLGVIRYVVHLESMTTGTRYVMRVPEEHIEVFRTLLKTRKYKI